MEEVEHPAEIWRSVSEFMNLKEIGFFEIASKDFRENHAEFAYGIRRQDEELRYLTYKERYRCSSGKALTEKEHCVDAITSGRGILCYGGGYGFGESTPGLVFDLRRDAEELLHKYDADGEYDADKSGLVLDYKDVFDASKLMVFNPPSFFNDDDLGDDPGDTHYACSAHTLDCFGNLQTIGGILHEEENQLQDIVATKLTHVIQIRHDFDYEERRQSRSTHAVPLPKASCYGAACTLPNGDILYTGGGTTPYRGSEVYNECYLKPRQIYAHLEKTARVHPLETCQITTNRIDADNLDFNVFEEAMFNRRYGTDDGTWRYARDPALRAIGWSPPTRPLPGPGSGTGASHDKFLNEEDEEWYINGKDIDELKFIGAMMRRNGDGSQTLSKAELRSLSSFVWSPDKVPPLLEGRCGHSVVATMDNKVVVLGGYGGGELYLETTEVLDLGDLDTGWQRGPSMHSKRSGPAAVVAAGGRVLVAGGSFDGEIPLNTVEALDPREGKWVKLAPMHHKRGYCAGTMAPHDRFLVSGGICDSAFGASDGLESYDSRANKWTLINQSVRGSKHSVFNEEGGSESESESDDGVMGEENAGSDTQRIRMWHEEYPAPLMDSFYRTCHTMLHLPTIRF